MANIDGNSIDLEPIDEPLLINDDNNSRDWNNHHDAELSNQRTVLNLNNHHVRLTLWSFIYLILTSAGLQNNNWLLSHYTIDQIGGYGEEVTYYSLALATDIIIWLSAAMLLCSYYCACINLKCSRYCVAVFFIVGAIMNFVTMIDGMVTYCKVDNYSSENTDYCRIGFVSGSIFLGLFTVYLAIDIMKELGDNIEIRILVKTVIIAIRSFLFASFWEYELDNYKDQLDTSGEYAIRTLSGSNMTVGIISSLIFIGCIYKINYQETKFHPFITRLLSYFLLIAVGSTLIAGFMTGQIYNDVFAQVSTYYVPAVALLVYDIQYL